MPFLPKTGQNSWGKKSHIAIVGNTKKSEKKSMHAQYTCKWRTYFIQLENIHINSEDVRTVRQKHFCARFSHACVHRTISST